jgi:glycine betaine/proline transport system permease protein
MLAVFLLAWQTGGWRLALPSVAALLFILLAGLWDETMVSLQLCGAGVIVSFLIGGALGVWSALNDRVSAALRPINDTLQTIPIFVFLIPGIMVFLVGEFTALIAIVMYAVVPAIRYTELGIRNVPPVAVEAARSFGATRWQLLWQVQLPVALPEIMLALNQTIMMALAMVVVAALVGAKGLGQAVMIGLTAGDPGLGVAAGLAIAFVAMITDRMIQSWSLRRKRELGLP